MEICECMYIQNEVVDSVCKNCRGDIYGCDCLPIHSRKCTNTEKTNA